MNLMALANMQRGDLESAEALFNRAQALAELATRQRQELVQAAIDRARALGRSGLLSEGALLEATSRTGVAAVFGIAERAGPPGAVAQVVAHLCRS